MLATILAAASPPDPPAHLGPVALLIGILLGTAAGPLSTNLRGMLAAWLRRGDLAGRLRDSRAQCAAMSAEIGRLMGVVKATEAENARLIGVIEGVTRPPAPVGHENIRRDRPDAPAGLEAEVPRGPGGDVLGDRGVPGVRGVPGHGVPPPGEMPEVP